MLTVSIGHTMFTLSEIFRTRIDVCLAAALHPAQIFCYIILCTFFQDSPSNSPNFHNLRLTLLECEYELCVSEQSSAAQPASVMMETIYLTTCCVVTLSSATVTVRKSQ